MAGDLVGEIAPLGISARRLEGAHSKRRASFDACNPTGYPLNCVERHGIGPLLLGYSIYGKSFENCSQGEPLRAVFLTHCTESYVAYSCTITVDEFLVMTEVRNIPPSLPNTCQSRWVWLLGYTKL